MKSIDETHPSLKYIWDIKFADCSKDGVTVKEVQEHTVDKAVLKKIIDEQTFEFEEPEGICNIKISRKQLQELGLEDLE